MKRRTFLKGVGTLALAPVPFVAARRASAQQPIVIKSANVHQVDAVIQSGHRKFAELVAERTNNRIQVQVFMASQLGTEQEILEGVQLGSVHMFEGSTGAAGRFLPELEAFSAPYVWKDIDHMEKTVRGPIGASLADRLLKAQGMRVLDFGWLFGYRYLTTKGKAISKPEDLRGMKIRVQPTAIYLEIIRAMGANPVPMDTKEVYLGLQTGVIDGQENTVDSIYSAKLYEVQKYLMMTGHILQNQTFLINEKYYQGLSPAFQQVIREATKDVWKKTSGKWEPGFYEKIQRFQAELK
jgi:tripartite ATP-independent transporter DctP family solute receptor